MNKKQIIMRQQHYGTIEIDGSEMDIVQIIMRARDPQIVMVERENIQRLIILLQTELPEKTAAATSFLQEAPPPMAHTIDGPDDLEELWNKGLIPFNFKQYHEAELKKNSKYLLSVLLKYIQYIKDTEGADYILDHDERGMSDAKFTDEDWEILTNLATILKNSK